MADYADVKIDGTAWVSLHNAHSIAAGTQIFFENTGDWPLRVALGAVAPTLLQGFGLRVPRTQKNSPTANLVQSTPVGAGDETWVICESNGKTSVSVQDAS